MRTEPPTRAPRIARQASTLTPVSVASIKPKAGQKFPVEYRDKRRDGLRLAVAPNGSKSFVIRYSFGGVYKRLVLGRHPAMSLGDAFTAFDAAADALARGEDPATARKAKRALLALPGAAVVRPDGTMALNPDGSVPPLTPDDPVSAWVEKYRLEELPLLAPGTQAYVKPELDRLIGAVGNKALRAVMRRDLSDHIATALARGIVARETTHKVTRAVVTWMSDAAEIPSPAADIRRPKTSHKPDNERALNDAEIPVLWRAATAAGGAVGAAVKLLLLTGCRRNEVFYLEQSEVGETAITISGARTKNRQPMTIPRTWLIDRVLAERAAEIQKQRDAKLAEARKKDEHAKPREIGRFVVTGENRGLGGHSQARAKIKTPGLAHWSFHDLRRTVMSGMAELDIPSEVAHRCLNHISGRKRDALTKIYDRADYAPKIIAAFEEWHERVAALVGEVKPDEPPVAA